MIKKNAADGFEAVSGAAIYAGMRRVQDQTLASLLCSAFL